MSGSIRHGFTKGKLCLTNLIAVLGKRSGLVDEERALDVI